MKYNGLQLVHMSYDKAYDFAGQYGMNAILVDLKSSKHEMFMCRLVHSEDKLRISNNSFSSFNANVINEGDYDIYWIGLKDIGVE